MAIAFGVSRKDWDALVQGDVRTFLGDAERFCVLNVSYLRVR
jgi:hypothetical protein